MTLGDRLRQVRGRLTQEEFGKSLGVSKSTIIRYEGGQTTPSTDFLADLEEKYNVRVDWLLTGVGLMYTETVARDKAGLYGRTKRATVGDQTLDVTLYEPERPPFTGEIDAPPPDPDEFAFLPMYEPRLSAGLGEPAQSERIVSYFAFRRAYVHRIGPIDKLVLFRVRGNSMSPLIRDGDTVLVDRSRIDIYNGYIFALNVGDAVQIKRLQTLITGDVAVLADNAEEFPPQTARREDVRIIGQVVWFARTLISL